MFIHVWHVRKSGKAVQLDPKDLPSAKIADGYVWIHMDAKHSDCRQWFIEDPLIDLHATDTLMADDSRPRTIPHEDSILVNMRGVNLNEESEPTDMVGIRFLVTGSRIISVQRRDLKATDDMVQQLKSQGGPVTSGGFIALYAEMLSDRMGPTITDMGEKIDDLEDQNDQVSGSIHRAVLSGLRRDALSLRRYLAPQRDALNTLALQNVKWISERDRLHLRHAADQATRITEELDAIRERCGVLRDYLSDQRAEEMNRNMMILSVVAAIFLPLGLISGMMGINVGGMPWTEDGMGFWYVTGIVVLIGFIQLIIFRILKWL